MFELKINFDEVVRYLGMKADNVDDTTAQDISKAVKLLIDQADYKVEYKIFSIEKKTDGVAVIGTNLMLTGKAIASLLKDCDKCILLAVTLGQNVDALLRKLQITRLSQAVIADFCASSMVEDLCNQFNDELKSSHNDQCLFLTDRFSAGYGDLPLTIQKDFCEVLSTQKTMGLAVTSSGLMIPRKSITAIIGIAKTPQKMKISGCKYCDFYKDCEYRKGGKVCD
ncbi:MAG: methionine synthase [Clostridia bacterium]